MIVKVIGSSSRLRIFDPFVQSEHLPIDVERFAWGDARQFINPAAPPHHSKEVTSENHVREKT
jgi:hypothetical protein